MTPTIEPDPWATGMMHSIMPWYDGNGLFVLVTLAAYFLPWIIASLKGHVDRTAIGLLNLLLGWTFVFWVVALVWTS